jgi:hypothetical protein
MRSKFGNFKALAYDLRIKLLEEVRKEKEEYK